MALLEESLERVWLELATIYRTERSKREVETPSTVREDLAWDLMDELERMWPERIKAIRERYQG